MDNQPARAEGADDDASRHVESSKRHAKKAVDDLLAAGSAKLQEIKDSAAGQVPHYYEVVRKRGKTLQSDSEQFARENPLRALAVALGLGFVLGVFLRR